MENNIVGEDMICPKTNKHCWDECCTVGSICNLHGTHLMKEFDYTNDDIKNVKSFEEYLIEEMIKLERKRRKEEFLKQ
jgi:hypothetical protein